MPTINVTDGGVQWCLERFLPRTVFLKRIISSVMVEKLSEGDGAASVKRDFIGKVALSAIETLKDDVSFGVSSSESAREVWEQVEDKLATMSEQAEAEGSQIPPVKYVADLDSSSLPAAVKRVFMNIKSAHHYATTNKRPRPVEAGSSEVPAVNVILDTSSMHTVSQQSGSSVDPSLTSQGQHRMSTEAFRIMEANDQSAPATMTVSQYLQRLEVAVQSEDQDVAMTEVMRMLNGHGLTRAPLSELQGISNHTIPSVTTFRSAQKGMKEVIIRAIVAG